MNKHLDALEFATTVEKHTNLESLTADFTALIQRFGFQSFIFTGLPQSGHDVAPLIIYDKWPAGWTEHYSTRNYFAADPVSHWSLSRFKPFRWREAQRSTAQTHLTRQIAGEAWEHGLVDGMAFPLRAASSNAVVSLSSEMTLDLDPHAGASLFLAVSYFNAAISDLNKSLMVVPRLTDRELEILRWAAAGKTAWETSCILSISERTVKLHRTSIRQKLDAATTTQAIASALRMQIFNP